MVPPVALVLLLACAVDAPPAPVVVPAGPEPTWPTVIAEDPAPAGYAWQTLAHESIHARMLVPDGAEITRSADGKERHLHVKAGPVDADLVYEPYAAFFIRDAPATARRTADNVAWSGERPDGGLHVVAYARGVRCTVDLGPFDRAAVERAFTVCASVRPPPLGPWAPPPGASATAVPTGAWVGPRVGDGVGKSLLGPYAPPLYAGSFTLTHTQCPDDDALAAVGPGEASVAITRHDGAGGPASVRTAQGERGGVTFDGSTRIVAPRGDGCCVAEVFPFTTAPSAAELDYVVALCDTTRGLQ